ncbi:CRISPR-associated endonuclease Cas1 [Acidihalobacter aeolianus]|uniref:CRISPR-associated endonuclease Cas1 n=1 Tax=Acidihalobacter aeolianus TaxID=2792603 RepID=A0A1D8K7B2_9GAMM|nr:CRISPR-associated endonuclease Cas1 [Acidihalobacter aeolianus]
MARCVLRLKLEAYLRRDPHLAKASQPVAASLEVALANLETADKAEALRGLEGAAAAQWFSALAANLDPQWPFPGRNRRPPRDPVNALLSLGYTLALGEARKQVLIQGLDPALGFLHMPAPARDGMALDALEPLRVAVDCIIVNMLDEFKPQDFTSSRDEGFRLSKAARGRFYALWSAASAQDFGGLFAAEQEAREMDESRDDQAGPPTASLAGAARTAVRRLRSTLPEIQPWDT